MKTEFKITDVEAISFDMLREAFYFASKMGKPFRICISQDHVRQLCEVVYDPENSEAGTVKVLVAK